MLAASANRGPRGPGPEAYSLSSKGIPTTDVTANPNAVKWANLAQNLLFSRSRRSSGFAASSTSLIFFLSSSNTISVADENTVRHVGHFVWFG
jgi:hypothetical protein